MESEGPSGCVFYTTADGSTVENEGERTLIMSATDGAQLRKESDFPSDTPRHLGRVSKLVRTAETVWCGVYVVDVMVAPPGRDEKNKPSSGWRNM